MYPGAAEKHLLALGDTCAMRLHLDTDIGGNVDDACALAMVLGWPGAEVLGITTTADPDGRRASYVMCVLDLVGRGTSRLHRGPRCRLSSRRPRLRPAWS